MTTSFAACRRAVLSAILASLAALPVRAATDDRAYRLGDDPDEGASAGITVGSGPANVAPGNTLDSQGPPGNAAFLDIFVNGTPTYISVADRPGAGATLGASFDGPASGDYLQTPVSMNIPQDMWDNANFFPPGNEFGLNYEGIYSHGIQLWAKPNAATQGVRQDIVIDTPQNGVYISATNRWGLQHGGGSFDGDAAVAFGAWTHVMQIAGNDPDDGRSNLGAALLVNGVAVAASPNYHVFNDTALSIGGNQGGTANLYHGVLDDVRIFLWGNNSREDNGGAGPNGQDWGDLNLAVDNEWIAARLATLGVTDPADVNLSGSVTPADVTAFLPDWLSRRLVNGLQVGDWTSRQNGDLNYDGITNLKDAFILHDGLLAAGVAGGLDFSLLGTGVPEPGTMALAALGLAGVGGVRRLARRGKRSADVADSRR